MELENGRRKNGVNDIRRWMAGGGVDPGDDNTDVEVSTHNLTVPDISCMTENSNLLTVVQNTHPVPN